MNLIFDKIIKNVESMNFYDQKSSADFEKFYLYQF